MKFNLGDRVRVLEKYNWARNALGTISDPPEFAINLVKDKYPWIGYHRNVKGVNEWIEFYWIIFDEPQFDADGDGPYGGSEIEAQMLEKV